jgi:hypothetical protein
MLRRKVVLGLAVCIVAMLLVSQSFSAAGGAGGRGGRGGVQGAQGGQRPGGGQGQDRDPEQMRARMQEMMDQRMKEQLGITGDDEWKVFQPRLQKVQDLSRQVNAGGPMAMFGGRGGRGGRGGFGGPGGRGPGGEQPQDRGSGARPGATDRELSAVEKAAQVLQDLATESPKADDIKAKLTAYRTAKETAKKDLAKAQQDLKQIVTVKQEATLVLMGMLN